MSKGVFSAILSGIASLSLFSLVLYVTLLSRPGTDTRQSQIVKATLLESRVDAFLRAGSQADTAAALQMMAVEKRTNLQKGQLASLFKNKRLFNGYRNVSLRAENLRCVSQGTGEQCEAQGIVTYDKEGVGNFSAVFVMENNHWNIYDLTINRN